jgi:hypothetical protein
MLRCRHLVAAIAIAVCAAFAPSAVIAQPFDAEDKAQDAYVQGNLLFLTYHEVGHLLLDSLLQVDQRQQRLTAEEVADDIATWLMLPDPDEPDQDEEILAAMFGWLDSAEENAEVARNPHYPDDAERAARIACYLYGSDPARYRELERMFRNAINSVNCEQEYEALQNDLEEWFHDFLVPPAPSNGGRVRVSYAEAPPVLEESRLYLIESQVLEHAVRDINQFIRLPHDVTLSARSCGGGAAEFRYNAARREITACYEAVAWFMGDAAAEVASRTTSNSDDMGSGGARVKQRPRPRPR